ncbi:hypothetical protein F511_25437 [Dorcoceras hygrometricum]|uniref:Uncharacterized protein n=1 Tax=Dorcoceras hygrometricum TaxID=472368 RepID=A0A2Z7C7H5_9LAMI|nr:hypothetical protein F511_25437 [Dorcoceras hygrometricum]
MDIVIWTRARWAAPKLAAPSSPKIRRRRRPPPSPPPPPLSDRTCSDQLFEEFPSVLISSVLLVQADEGTLLPVVDLIRRNLPPPTVKCRFPRETGRSQASRRQQDEIRIRHGSPTDRFSNNRLGVDASGKGGRVRLLSILGFDPMSLWGLVYFLVVLFSENPGFTAGRGFNPAGGAPGGG